MIRFLMAMAVFVGLAFSTASAEDLAAENPQTSSHSEVTAPDQDAERATRRYRNTRERWRGAPYVNEDRRRALDFQLPPVNSTYRTGDQAVISGF